MKPWIGRDGNVGPRATDGQPYITLASGGIKPEGAPIPARCASEKKAWDSYNEVLADMVAKHPGCIIEWRVRPYLEVLVDKRRKPVPVHRYWVRSRLAFVKAAA